MSEKPRDIPWVDSNLFTENSSKVPYEELVKYAGQVVAWTLDGTRILASAPDDLELDKRLKEMGIDPSRVVGVYMPPADVTSIL
jgi:hypothetical protein